MKIKKRTLFVVFLFIVIIGLLAFRIVNRLSERQQEEIQHDDGYYQNKAQ